MNLVTRVRTWLNERLHFADLVGPLEKKTVPVHKLSHWYFLGGITLFLFMVQVCTGCCSGLMKPTRRRGMSVRRIQAMSSISFLLANRLSS